MKNRYFIFIVGFFTISVANAQIAAYDFDGDLTDNVSSYDASSNNSLTFLNEDGRSFVTLSESDVIQFPASLSTIIFAEESFEIQFDLRIEDSDAITDCCAYPIPIFSNFHDADGGFKLSLMHWPGESYLVFDYFDGVDVSDQIYLTYDPDPELSNWRTFNLVFDMDKNLWRIQIGNNTITKEIVQGFNKTAFKQGIAEKQVIFAGLENQSELTNPGLYIDELSLYGPALSYEDAINNAYAAMTDDLNGDVVLSEEDKEAHSETIIQNLYFQDYGMIKDNLMVYTQAYETMNPPMYEDGISYLFEDLPVHDRIFQFSQGYVFETQFVAGNLTNVNGIIFEHSEVAPGSVAPGTSRIATVSVEVNGTYHRDIAAELADQSRVVRPTGYYVAAGDIVTITVQADVIDKGLSVIVGAHFRKMDYDYIGDINRFPDISAEYPLDVVEIQVANPFGGGIYLKVPEGTSAGTFSMEIENAIQAPYFSWREGYKTDVSEWLDVLANTGAPWADFESDKFMFTIPTSELTDITNPDEIMTRWDAIMDAVRLVAGRPTTRPRAEYYSFDTRLVTPAYGAGYPLIIPLFEAFRGNEEEGWNPVKVMEFKPHATLLHEMGHNHLHPTMGYGGDLDQCHFLEAETINHMLAMSIYSNVYGLSKEEAFKESSVLLQKLGFYQAAFDWIITSNFRNNLRMYEEEDAPTEDKNQLHYQPRSWAKYGDIARLFGWEGIGSVNGQFYTEGVQQSSTVCDWRGYVVGRDEYIRAASFALGVNMTPLFHFWGINPSEELIIEMQSYPQSPEIYNLLIDYRDNVAPKTLADYMVYHDQFPIDDYQYARYEQYILEFDSDFAAAIEAQFTFLIATYFPPPNTETDIIAFSFAEETSPAIIDEVNHTVTIEVVNETDLTSLTPIFSVSARASVSVKNIDQESGITDNDFTSPVTYTVTAEDGITTQDWVATVSEEVILGIEYEINNVSVYPNPVKEELVINLVGFRNEPVILSVTDLSGREIEKKQFNVSQQITLDVTKYLSGIYFAQMQQGKNKVSFRFIKN